MIDFKAMRVLLTGATGFIGSHLAEYLLQKGMDLLLTRRKSSKTSKCISFLKKVNWIYTDENDWDKKAVEFKPEIIIHAAWNGVENNKRNDWSIQLSNIDFQYKLHKIASESNVKKIICLGSQAEYGHFNLRVNEDYQVKPLSSYGILKLANLEMLKSFCIDNRISWYWLRIFSVLGENDNAGWLLPTVIQKLKNNESIDLTPGEQSYDYLYIQDLNKRLLKVIFDENNNSGIYNVCSGEPVKIKDLLEKVAEKMEKPKSLLKFGVLEYRPDQTMMMVGDSTKFDTIFGISPTQSIDETINRILSL